MLSNARVPVAGLVLLVLLAGCTGPADTQEAASQSPSASASAPGTGAPQDPAAVGPLAPVIEGDVLGGLVSPWSVAVIDETSALVSQRDDGTILLTSRSESGWSATIAGRLAETVHSNEGGLMGLALDPSGTKVYAMLTTARDNRVVAMPFNGTAIGPPTVVIDGLPKAEIHNGGRITFGPDGMLYVATGDAGDPDSAQRPDSLAGKILRLSPDGAIPPDNPFPGSPVLSLGHRNVQGLAFDDQGNLWASEFGAKDYDEINRIEAGANYGWPIVEGPGGGAGLTDPQASFSPTSTASPSGLAFAEGSLWVASLRGQTLYQVPVSAGVAQQPIGHFTGEFGRLRDVVNGPGGSIWVLTNNTDGRGDPRPGDDRLIEVSLQPDS